jgi:adenine-specific DNA-methyltransferase
MIECVVARFSKNNETLPLACQLQLASELLYQELEQPSDQILEWVKQSGLQNGKSELRRVLAQQAAFQLTLITLFEHLSNDLFLTTLPFTEILRESKARAICPEILLQIPALQNLYPRDVLGELYEQFIPQSERRTLGQFWTPQPLVELMTAWAVQAGDYILEPALGSGRFLQAITEQVKSPRVKGYEISPLVLLLARVNTCLQAKSLPTSLQAKSLPTLDLLCADYLTAKHQGQTFDAVICNPPYTRHHHITNELKAQLSQEIQNQFGVRISGFTSLFVYFFLKALTQLRIGGRLAFITPSELFEASYAKMVKTILQNHAIPEAIIGFDPSTQVFAGVDTAGCITLATRGYKPKNTVLIELKTFPGTAILLEAIRLQENTVFEWGTVQVVPVEQLIIEAKWSNFQQMKTLKSQSPPLNNSAKIMRGIATGANDYFCLTDQEVEQLKLPTQYLQPVITKTRLVPDLYFTKEHFETLRNAGHKVWLFNCTEPRDRLPSQVRKYIEYGEGLGLHQRSLLSLKNGRWYMAEQRQPPPILFTYLSRGKTRFIHNVMGAQALNVFLLAYPNAQIAQNPERIKALVAILNSSVVTEQLQLFGRSYGGDTIKLEPRELDALPILDPLCLSQTELLEINQLFDALCANADNSTHQKALNEFVHSLQKEQVLLPKQPPIQAHLFQAIHQLTPA